MSSNLTSKALLMSQTKLQIHPDSDYIINKAKETIDELDIKVENLYSGYANMSVYLYPSASLTNAVSASIFFNILYYFDELYGEDTRTDIYVPTINEVKLMWEKEEIKNVEVKYRKDMENLLKGIKKIKEIIAQSKSSELGKRITYSLMKHLQHAFHPKEYKSIDEYIGTRLEFSGMYLSIDMMEYVYEIYLEDKIFESIPELKRAKDLCAELGALSNDIFSYPKEEKSPFNLINAISSFNHTTKEESIIQAISIVNDKYLEYIENIKLTELALKKLPENRHIEVEKFVEGLNEIVSASYHWQLSTKRYKHPLHFLQDMK